MPSPRFANWRILALCLALSVAPLIPAHQAHSQITQAINNASSSLAVAHAVGSGTLQLKSG